MDPKFIWPLVGVALGWALSTLTELVRARQTDKRALGNVIASMFVLYQELLKLSRHHELYKDRIKTWQEYEVYRAYAAKRYLGKLKTNELIDESQKILCGARPLDAIELDSVKVILDSYVSHSLTEISKLDDDVYVAMLSVHEVGYDIASKTLRKILLRLSRIHGIGTWFRVVFRLRRQKKSLQIEIDKDLGKLSKQLNVMMSAVGLSRRGTNEEQPPDPDPDAAAESVKTSTAVEPTATEPAAKDKTAQRAETTTANDTEQNLTT